ncbi:MAG: hypothetical protein WCX46_02405 [Candidatus Paceibacterota bacterium]|jgi:hypothetical protein
MNISDTSCCGLDEFQDISDEPNNKEILKKMKRHYHHDSWGESPNSVEEGNLPTFILFTGVTKEKYGSNLEKFILKNKYGTITKTKSKLNSNSGNQITAWIWTLNKKNLVKKLNTIKVEPKDE